MRHYCSLADSKYLPQLIVLYESLKKHSSEEFLLHVLALDKQTADVLQFAALDDDIIVRELEWLERREESLDGIRQSRTWQEYCWTLASAFSWWLLEWKAIDAITYLDADLMFFSDPRTIFDEIGERSIAVIPHRLAENKDKARLSKNGKFNVSWVTFKNNPIGRECLSTWAAQCRERCSAEVGCGDQGYLDSWPAKYGKELCVIQNIGAGVAPWNISQYSLANYRLSTTPQVDGVPIVFYHYHELRKNDDGTFRLTNYALREEDKRMIYAPYIAACIDACKRIQDSRASVSVGS